jgi:hypothetical protein
MVVLLPIYLFRVFVKTENKNYVILYFIILVVLSKCAQKSVSMSLTLYYHHCLS